MTARFVGELVQFRAATVAPAAAGVAKNLDRWECRFRRRSVEQIGSTVMARDGGRGSRYGTIASARLGFQSLDPVLHLGDEGWRRVPCLAGTAVGGALACDPTSPSRHPAAEITQGAGPRSAP